MSMRRTASTYVVVKSDYANRDDVQTDRALQHVFNKAICVLLSIHLMGLWWAEELGVVKESKTATYHSLLIVVVGVQTSLGQHTSVDLSPLLANTNAICLCI